MKHIFYLGTCDTCRRILNELAPLDGFTLQDIKSDPLSTAQLDGLHGLAGSYSELFSKRARAYRQRGLQDKSLSEADLRGLILEDYTFLKRPVIVVDDAIFIGNSPKTVAAAKAAIHP